jgi:hypothetical protein
MMLVSWILALGAVCLAGLSLWWGRAGRLSPGHTTAWLLLGVGLFLAVLLIRILPGVFGREAAWVALLLAVVGVTAFALAHAVALTRLDERVRSLAQEVALLREAGGKAAREEPRPAPVAPPSGPSRPAASDGGA